MTDIIVDSRRCGEGKTRDDTDSLVRDKGRILSTWANIKNRWELNDRCLVVLPSLALCEYYYEELSRYLTEQNALTSNQLAMITSNGYYQDSADRKPCVNVQKELHQSLLAGCNIVIITHAAWQLSDIPSTQRQRYHLIIDEAVMPYREIAVYHDAECGVDFNWSQNTSLLQASDGAVEWCELRFNNIAGNFITDSSDVTRDLFNANWRCRVHIDDYQKFASVIPKTERISVIQELLPTLFDNYGSIWIACAAFEYTFMRFWMDAHNISWRIHRLLGFKPHEVPVTLMGPDDAKFHWSSYKQNTEPELIKQFSQQTRGVTGSSSVLVLRNTSQNRQIYQTEQLLPHNSAGSNKYTDYRFVSLESALNPTPNMTRFLYAVYGIGAGTGENGVSDTVHMAQTVYTFYQTVMRCCLRRGEPATVFTLDNRVILGLAEFFTNVQFEEIRLVRNAGINPVGRPATGQKHTGTEKTFLSRKRRDPKYLGWTDAELLALRNN